MSDSRAMAAVSALGEVRVDDDHDPAGAELLHVVAHFAGGAAAELDAGGLYREDGLLSQRSASKASIHTARRGTVPTYATDIAAFPRGVPTAATIPRERLRASGALPYPGGHAGVQHIERQRAAVEDLVVEGAQIESRPSFSWARSRSLRISSSPSL